MRTGFPQSYVSAWVARFREAGSVETDADPVDRRRTLVPDTAAFGQHRIREAAALEPAAVHLLRDRDPLRDLGADAGGRAPGRGPL